MNAFNLLKMKLILIRLKNTGSGTLVMRREFFKTTVGSSSSQND